MKKVVVCFGDSLTWGWWKRGHGQDPYSHVLNKDFATYSSRLVALQFGIAGETTAKMKERIGGVLKEVKGQKAGIWYPDMEAAEVQCVIVCGGTNDLANPSLSAADIFTNLRAIVEVAQLSTPRVALCTLLPFNLDGDVFEHPRRRHGELNELIRKFCLETQLVRCIDLERALPSRAQEPTIWNDAVHFNDKGYSLMGSVILDVGNSSMLFSESIDL